MNRILSPRFRLVVLGALLITQAAVAQTAGNLTLSATINDTGSGPEHWTVVWVTNATTGAFVRTIRRQANEPRGSHWNGHCGSWYAAAGLASSSTNFTPGVDGFTGATAATYDAPNSPFTQVWSCKDASGSTLPDGDYRVWIQYAEDVSGQGPVTAGGILWTKGASSYSSGTLSQLPDFTSISVTWTPAAAASTVSVAVSPASVAEDAAPNLVYTFTRSGVTSAALTASFTVTGSATFNTDYTQSGAASFSASAGTVTFAAGASTALVTLNPTVDTTVESAETATLTVTSGSGYTAGVPSAATGTITNDDTTVSVAVSPASVAEDAAPNLVYTLTRSGVTSATLTASFTVTGSATFNTDYTQSGAASFSASAGTVTFAAGASTALVTLDPTVDAAVESDETATITVTSGSGYTVGAPSAATGTITNDDTTVSVAVSPASVAEDAAPNLVYTFTRSGITSGALTASFSVTGSATFNTDYTQSGAAGFSASAGTVTFAAGASTALVTLDPTADLEVESDETATLTVTSGSGYTAGVPSAATGTITNDDTTVSVAVSPASVAEDAAPNLVYTFTRSGVTSATLTASFTVTGSATFNTDYTQSGAAGFSASAGTVTFAAGASTALVTLDPTVDTAVESDETAILTVTSGSGYTAGAPSAATGTITNDDITVSAPEIVVEQNAGNIADGGSKDFGTLAVGSNTNLSFTIKNTGNGDLTGLVITKGGANPDDFTVTSSPVAPVAGPNGTTACTVQFAPGATGSRSSTLQISNNDADEAPFDITLTGTGMFFDDFDPSYTPELWVQFGGGVTANSNGQAAGSGTTGNSLWLGGDGSRFATTQALDTRAGGGVSFLLALANGTSNPWETADPGEEVVLEYSNDGANFVQFGGPYNNRVWQKFVLTIPAAAQTSATRFRFRQLANSGAAYDHWAIDNVQIGSSVVMAPEITVEQPVGTGLADGTSTVYFNLEGSDLSHSRTFTIRNPGTADLTGLDVTKDGTNANLFTLGSLGANTLAPGAATTFTVTFTPGATGPRTAAIHISSNDADKPQFDIDLTGGVVPVSPFAAWMMAANLPLAQSGADQTPQHDGVTNLLKYACNLDPSKPDVRTLNVGGHGLAGLPGGALAGGKLRLEFLRRKASTNPGITYTPQFSSFIGAWVDVPGVLQGVSIDPIWERVVVDDPAPGPGRRFGRLRVVQSP